MMLVISLDFLKNNTIKEYTEGPKLDIKFTTLLLFETMNFLLQILKIEPIRERKTISL